MQLEDGPRSGGSSGRGADRATGSTLDRRLLRTAVGALRRPLYPLFWRTGTGPRRRPQEGTRATVNQSPPWLNFITEESNPTERLRVSNRIMPGLYDDAVKEAVELCLLAVLQHIVDPTRVGTIADQNSAVTQFNLRPTSAD